MALICIVQLSILLKTTITTTRTTTTTTCTVSVRSKSFKQVLSSSWDGWLCQSKVGQKVRGGVGCCTPSVGGAGSLSNTMWPGPRPTFIRSGILIHAEFGHNTLAKKWGLLCHFRWEGKAGSPSNTMWLGWGLPPYQVASWSIQLFGHNRYGPKIWGTVSQPPHAAPSDYSM